MMMDHSNNNESKGPVDLTHTTKSAKKPTGFVFTPQHADQLYYAVPLGLTLLGIFHSDISAYYAALFDCVRLVIPTILAAMLGFHLLFAAVGNRLQAYKTDPPKYASEIKESVVSMYVMCTILAWPVSFVRLGYPHALRFSLAEAQPWFPESLALYFAKLFAMTLATDYYMYWKHRLLHSHMFEVFHSRGIHHMYHNPSPFSAFALHPVEALLSFWMTIAVVIPYFAIWAQAQAVWIVFFVSLNMYLHAGYEIDAVERWLPMLFVNTSPFHNLHHEKKVTNFGEVSYLWDYLCRTGYHPYGWNLVASIDEAKQYTVGIRSAGFWQSAGEADGSAAASAAAAAAAAASVSTSEEE